MEKNNILKDFINNLEKTKMLYRIDFYNNKYCEVVTKYVPASDFEEAYEAAKYIESKHVEYSKIKQITELHAVTIIPHLMK